jgi:hypothetical protein
MVELGSRVAVPRHVLVRTLDKESVLLNLETERYFGLDEVGTRMWQVLTTSPSVEEAYRRLLDEYDVEGGQLRENLLELLDQLLNNGLLHVLPGDTRTNPAI